MYMIDPVVLSGKVPGILIREPEGILFTELNSPALIILKTDAVQSDDLVRYGSFLSEKESVKSRRFRFPGDRMSYIAVHGLLRLMLGRYLGIPPETVDITYNEFGKPSVTGYSRQVFFNLSHSSGVSVLGFDPKNELGIDVERMHEEFEYESIVQLFFTKKEGRYIQHSKEESRKRFYEIWTRKEAYLKAIGTGITENLRVEVLKERMNGKTAWDYGSGHSDFIFRSILFEQNYRITLAMNPGSGYIRLIVPGVDEKGISIKEG